MAAPRTPNAAERAAIVVDSMGHQYVAIHPGYAMSPSTYRGALATRIVVCVLAFASLVLNVVGGIVPYYSTEERNYDYPNGGETVYFSLWMTWRGSLLIPEYPSSVVGIAALMSCISLVLTIIAIVLAGVLAGSLARAEKARLEDKADSELAMAKYGRLRQEYGDTGDSDSFPYTNLRVINRGHVAEVAYEARELARRTYDRSICAAALSMLIVADIVALTTVCLMGAAFSDGGYGGYWYYSQGAEMGPGIPLMAVATVLLFVAFIVVSIPQITSSPLCGSLVPQRCALMVLDERTTREVQAYLMRLMQGGDGSVDAVTQGVLVALPGVPMGDLNPLYHTQDAAFSPVQVQHSGNGVVEVPPSYSGGYTAASYRAAPRQLFNVQAAGAACGEPDVVVRGGREETQREQSGVPASSSTSGTTHPKTVKRVFEG